MTITNTDENAEKLDHSHLAGGDVKLAFYYKMKHAITIQSSTIQLYSQAIYLR